MCIEFVGERETMLEIVNRAQCDGVRYSEQLMFHKVSIITKGNRKTKYAHKKKNKSIETNDIVCAVTSHRTELD